MYELSTQEKKVGLILNRSSIHTNDEIVDYMDKLGFVVEFIHAGITSIEQPCDLRLNKPLKYEFSWNPTFSMMIRCVIHPASYA